MPLKNGKFTEREVLFVDALARTGDADYAADIAKYSPAMKSMAINSPAVAAAVRDRHREFILGEAVPAAQRVHLELLTDPRCPAAVRARLVSLAYEELREVTGDKTEAEVFEMTAEQLAHKRAQLEAQIAAYDVASAAKAIDVTPVAPLPGIFD